MMPLSFALIRLTWWKAELRHIINQLLQTLDNDYIYTHLRNIMGQKYALLDVWLSFHSFGS